jgi:hypothetical protein
MTDTSTFARELVVTAPALAALTLAIPGIAAPPVENEAILTEGKGEHTLPEGARRQTEEPALGDRTQHGSAVLGSAPLEDEVNPIRPFSDLDLDGDGVLTPDEAHASPRIGDDWRSVDTNNDGVIDRSEMSLVVEDVPPTAEEARR